LQDAKEEGCTDANTRKDERSFTSKLAIEPECETKRVMFDHRVPDKVVMVSQDLSSSEEVEMLSFLDKISDVFAWQTSDLIGVSRDIIEHKL
jgi:hypothetical protein